MKTLLNLFFSKYRAALPHCYEEFYLLLGWVSFAFLCFGQYFIESLSLNKKMYRKTLRNSYHSINYPPQQRQIENHVHELGL